MGDAREPRRWIKLTLWRDRAGRRGSAPRRIIVDAAEIVAVMEHEEYDVGDRPAVELWLASGQEVIVTNAIAEVVGLAGIGAGVDG